MPMGVTHRRINTALSIPLTAGALVVGWTPLQALCLFAGYNFATYFVNPDLDLNSIGYQSWGWLRFIWWPYQKILGHRSWFSHFPVISTLLRIVYFLWFPIVLIFLLGSTVQSLARDTFFDYWPLWSPYILVFVAGMIVSDALHAILDTASTELKQVFGGSRRSRGTNFFEHHGERAPRRVRGRSTSRSRRSSQRRRY